MKKKPKVTFARSESRRSRVLESEEDFIKLLELCNFYNIENGNAMFYELALALARDFLPEPKNKGVKKRIPGLLWIPLVDAVNKIVVPNDRNHGVQWACRQLTKIEPWKTFTSVKGNGVETSNPAEILRKWYYSNRNKNVDEEIKKETHELMEKTAPFIREMIQKSNPK